MRPPTLTALAEAVADGDAINWDHAEASAETDEERHVVQQLRQLATLRDAARAKPAMWGPLEIRDEIGHGTFGTVYKAWDSRLHREVALKLLGTPASKRDVASAVIKEGQLLARIHHENVVTVYGADVFDDRVGIWMEFVKGHTLKQIVEEHGVLGAAEAAVVGRDVCRALAAVHREGFLHRDVKAQNVMRAASGRTVLMDFGTGTAASMEETPALGGTPVYLAPELLAGGAPTVQSDLYSVGVLLFYLVSGQFPVTASSFEDLKDRHARGTRRLLRDVKPELSGAFASVVDDTLSPDPGARPQSAGGLQMRLEAALLQRDVPPAVTAARRLRSWWAAAIAAAAIIAIAVAALFVSQERSTADQSVAILPLRDLSETGRDEAAFSDGITDDLIAHLSSLKDLRVISGNSVRRYLNANKTETEIGQALGVTTVLDGSVRRFDGRVRIVSRLVDARTGQQLWSESFERDLKDVPAMQSEVARKIAVALKVELSDPGNESGWLGRSQSYEAFSLYSKGRYHWKNRKDDGRDLDESIRYYQQAIALQPSYALAYAGLADSYMAQGVYNILPRSVAMDLAEQTARKAVELDDSLPEAHASLGYIIKNRFLWAQAEASFRRAIELKPSFSEAHHWLSVLFTQQGRLPEAISEIKAAILLDPLSLPAQMQLGSAYLMARRYDTARAQFEQVLHADPGIAVAYRAISVSYVHQGRYDEALQSLAKAGALMAPGTEDRDQKSYRGYVLALAGRRSEALQIRDELANRYARAGEPLGGNIAAIDVALGNHHEALDWLEKAVAVNDPELNYLKVDPRWDPLRNENRFRALLTHLGLP